MLVSSKATVLTIHIGCILMNITKYIAIYQAYAIQN